MLDELHVRNIGVIDDLTIQLGPGMTVISGETGAGKTLLVDALSLLAGQRADTGLVRTGAGAARVEARFRDGSYETLVVREIPADSPSRSYINGSLCRVSDLARLSIDLFHLYGQHDAQILLSPGAQAQTLDKYSSVSYGELQQVKTRLKEAQARLGQLGGDERSRQRELAGCQIELEEILAAAVEDPDEEMDARQEVKLLSNVLEFRTALTAAIGLLIENDDAASAMDHLGEARRVLGQTGEYSSIVDQLSGEIDSLRETGRDIRIELDRLDVDPNRFESLQERLAELAKVKRKYGETLSDVIDYREKLESRIAELQSYEFVALQIEQEIELCESEITRVEKEIFGLRRSGAERLSQGVTSRLRSLAMPHGRFDVEFGKMGAGDPVTFMFSSNAGEKLGPVSKVASGGELSRLMLAIRLVSGSEVPTMVFDEVDAGVGGKAAVNVGKALAELAQTRQVIVVTHLPQVAAFAQHQVAISKSVQSGRTVTLGRLVEGEERVSEIARMLSGQNDSQKARDHARELLVSAKML